MLVVDGVPVPVSRSTKIPSARVPASEAKRIATGVSQVSLVLRKYLAVFIISGAFIPHWRLGGNWHFCKRD